MKKTRGFSYVEILIAMALFSIAMLAILPTLSQAARNLIFAHDNYSSHLKAQRIMLGVRDALMDDMNPEASAVIYAANRFEFSFWVQGQVTMEFHSDISIFDGQNAVAAVMGKNSTMASNASTIIVVVWCEEGHIAGRAIGMLYHMDEV